MQTLRFHPKWETTISDKDRKQIQEIFEKETGTTAGVQLSVLWSAVNHKKEQLVTALIHNYSKQPLHFEQQRIRYQIDSAIVAEHVFTLPFTVDTATSVPWTFIFPKAENPIDILDQKETLLME